MKKHTHAPPSIEVSLSRARKEQRSFPIARRMIDMPVAGSVARAWVRLHRSAQQQTLWASLPPVQA
jgi:hypothetical protein